jgi:hypothetical protein
MKKKNINRKSVCAETVRESIKGFKDKNELSYYLENESRQTNEEK